MERCKHVIWRGDKKGQQCERMTLNTYCYKHKDSIAASGKKEKSAQALVSDPVFGHPEEQKQVRSPNVKSSVYLVTINLNKAINNLTSADKQKFKDFIEYVFDRNTLLTDYLRDSNGHDPSDVIESLDIEYHFEVGGTAGRLHAHAYINLQHRGHFTLNVSDIRALGRKVFNDNLHVNVQVTSDPTIRYKNYTRKIAESS